MTLLEEPTECVVFVWGCSATRNGETVWPMATEWNNFFSLTAFEVFICRFFSGIFLQTLRPCCRENHQAIFGEHSPQLQVVVTWIEQDKRVAWGKRILGIQYQIDLIQSIHFTQNLKATKRTKRTLTSVDVLFRPTNKQFSDLLLAHRLNDNCSFKERVVSCQPSFCLVGLWSLKFSAPFDNMRTLFKFKIQPTVRLFTAVNHYLLQNSNVWIKGVKRSCAVIGGFRLCRRNYDRRQ